MEQAEQTNEVKVKQELTKEEQVKEDRKVQAENMRLKKQVKILKEYIDNLEKFIRGE